MESDRRDAAGLITPSGYNISYKNTEFTECFTISETIPIISGSTSGQYDIVNLQEGTEYSITVSLIRNGAITDRNTVLHHTLESGTLYLTPSSFNLLISSLSLEPTAPPSGVTSLV